MSGLGRALGVCSRLVVESACPRLVEPGPRRKPPIVLIEHAETEGGIAFPLAVYCDRLCPRWGWYSS
jgi:hypothetical protein